MLKIMDRPGCITQAEMRFLFEGAISQTPVFRTNTPLGAVTINGEFSHYAAPETDTMWLGWALGMRCAERLSISLNAPEQPAPPAQALRDAATSLETISRLAGKSHYVGDDGERIETYMEHHDQVRGYAHARATCARKAIAAHEALTAAPAKPSPTAGMNIAQRILHVGGRNNAAGYVEFGSTQAVEALVRQVLRDLPPGQAAPEPNERERIRAAQDRAVMPLIGPLLDAWENTDREVMAEEPELANWLDKINRAMETAGDDEAAPEQPAQADCGNAECAWRGPVSECSMLGSVGPLCPHCREIVEPDLHPETDGLVQRSANGHPVVAIGVEPKP